MSTVARAVIENSRVGAGDDVLVDGPGPIGLLTAQIADAEGGTVAVSDAGRDAAYRLPLAEELGFEAVNVETDDADARRDRHTGGVGYDVVFDVSELRDRPLAIASDGARRGSAPEKLGDRPRTNRDSHHFGTSTNRVEGASAHSRASSLAGFRPKGTIGRLV